EIYARHGRKFKSKELQNYFNSKDWYEGTVDSDKFDESVLSSTEKKNASFLATEEFDRDPKGYQLDQ
ncbi:MAG: YARHG domain-containing protein, partial [Lachnospiraceae bacterium]